MPKIVVSDPAAKSVLTSSSASSQPISPLSAAA
jgi:hypothetical protein